MFNIKPVYAGFPAAGPPFAGFGRRVRAGRIGAFIVALFFLFSYVPMMPMPQTYNDDKRPPTLGRVE